MDIGIYLVSIAVSFVLGMIATFVLFIIIHNKSHGKYSNNDRINDIKIIVEDKHPSEQMIGLIKNVLNTNKE